MADETPLDKVVVSVADAFELAVDLHRNGRLVEAEAMYEAVLKLVPDEPRVLHFLGVVTHQLGRGEEGASLVRRALEKQPDWADAWNNLGNILKEERRSAEAVEAYDRALALNPDWPDALSNRGVTLKNMGRLEEAERSFRRAIELNPDHAESHFNLGNLLERRERHDEAVREFETALRLKPGRGPVWRHLTNALAATGRIDQARRVIEEWLAFEPGDPTALHMRAAVFGGEPPGRASNAYVKVLFGAVATQFDEKLEALCYRAPQLIVDAVAKALGDRARDLDVLDAGAGTGLCGPLVKPLARRLVGVDLSADMLLIARGRRVYDELEEAELTAWLDAAEETFDVAICADTLCYFGVLDEVLKGFARVLRPGGLLAFTVEKGDGDAYVLQRNGRYNHGEPYVRGALAAAGLAARSIATETLRMEVGQPVAGLLVVAGR